MYGLQRSSFCLLQWDLILQVSFLGWVECLHRRSTLNNFPLNFIYYWNTLIYIKPVNQSFQHTPGVILYWQNTNSSRIRSRAAPCGTLEAKALQGPFCSPYIWSLGIINDQDILRLDPQQPNHCFTLPLPSRLEAARSAIWSRSIS